MSIGNGHFATRRFLLALLRYNATVSRARAFRAGYKAKRKERNTDMNREVKSYMHVALVLDASGSMESIRSATIDSLKKFFGGLKSEEDKTLLDVWQFDSEVKHLADSADLNEGAPQTLERYTTGGCTALYDAICIGIDELGRKFAAMPEPERPDGIVFAILTDGFENASRSFTCNDVREKIEHQSSKYNWQFRFLGANQDAISTGGSFGLCADDCETFEASIAGIGDLCAESSRLARCMSEVRLSSRAHRASRKR